MRNYYKPKPQIYSVYYMTKKSIKSSHLWTHSEAFLLENWMKHLIDYKIGLICLLVRNMQHSRVKPSKMQAFSFSKKKKFKFTSKRRQRFIHYFFIEVKKPGKTWQVSSSFFMLIQAGVDIHVRANWWAHFFYVFLKSLVFLPHHVDEVTGLNRFIPWFY